MLHSYDKWFEDHTDELNQVEDYWTKRDELITTLKGGATILMARATEDDDDDDNKEVESPEGDGSQARRLVVEDAKAKARRVGKIIESVTSGVTITFISRLSRASTEAITTIGPPPMFDPLKICFYYLEVEFGGIRRDQMRHIHDFKKEIGDTPRIIYVRLARFARKNGDAFTKRQMVSLYMAKQDKKLQDMAHPHMLLMCGGQATLAQTYALVE